MTYSFPCQDLSLAGKGKGMSKDSGTRSGLLWEVERILNECGKNLPQILVMENVPQVIGQKNIKDFQEWELFLERKGYSNYIKILNAKNYGIPQNRQRCFMVSILGNAYYEFPKKIKLKTKLKDLLEDQVDEQYYLSKKMIDYITSKDDKYEVNENNLIINREIACSKTTREGNTRADASDYISNELPQNINILKIKNATKKGYTEAKDGDGVDISTRMETHRGTVQKDVIQTIKAQLDVGVVVKENLKEKLCNKLLKDGIVEDGDVIRHSYTNNRLENDDKNLGRVESKEKLAPTLDTRCDTLGVVVNEYSEIEKQLFTEDGNIKRYIDSDIVDKFEEGQMATTSYPNGYGHGTRTHDESISLNTIDRPSVKQNLRIRKITPMEAWRLMGFTSEDFDKASKVNSNAQLYKQAGNSIVVQVLMGIFGKLMGMSDSEIETKIRKSIEEIK